MKRVLHLFLLIFSLPAYQALAQADHLVISEVYGGGGNAGSVYKNDYIELYNPTSAAISLTGYSVQYNSAAGTAAWQVTNLSGSIPAKGFYLVKEAAGTAGTTELPAADAAGAIPMAGAAGKVALCSSTAALSGASPSSLAIIDLVGFGTASFFEGSAAPAPSNTASIERKANSASTAAAMAAGGTDVSAGNGYDTNNNGSDFVAQASQSPQNSGSPAEPVSASAASLTVNPLALTFGNQAPNAVSASQSYTLSAANLTENVTVTAPEAFTVSKDNAAFSSSLTFTALELVSAQTIYVKFSAAAAGEKTGDITHESTGASTQKVKVSGYIIDPAALSFNFNSCTNSGSPGLGFTTYSVTGAQAWVCTTFGYDPANPGVTYTNGVNMNGFSAGNKENEDWLITPALDLSGFGSNSAILSFYSRAEFSGPALQLKVSTNYPGSGNPANYTWTNLNGFFPEVASNKWTFSDNIDLSAYKQAGVYIAFVYTSSTEAAARWTIDDAAVRSAAAQPSPVTAFSATSLNYKYVPVNTNSDKTVTASLSNLTAAVSVKSNNASFTVSADGSAFSNEAVLAKSSVNNSSPTIYIRFSPAAANTSYTGQITLSTSGTADKAISLKGDTYSTAATLDVVNWNIEWFGSTESGQGPSNDDQQQANVKTILTNLDADIYALSEVVDTVRFKNMAATMPGYAYAAADFGSYADNKTDPDYPGTQKLAFLYKTSMVSNIKTMGLLRCTEAENCASFRPWASGRFPYLLTANVTANGFTQKVNFVLIHAKANTGTDTEKIDAYNRRKTGADQLKAVLDQAPYKTENVILLGDFNDDLNQTIAPAGAGTATSYSQFVNDSSNYVSITKPLSLAGQRSTASFTSVIDNVIISSGMANFYLANSAAVLPEAANMVTSYSSTTTDHYPVLSRYLFTSNGVLPVSLSSFTASVKGSTVAVKWTTASEKNNQLFEVQKSKDLNNFETVTAVNGSGNSNTLKSYAVTDAAPFSGSSYYRLKQTDFNGNISYSELRTVTILAADQITFFPNPFQDKLQLHLSNPGALLTVSVLSAEGKVLLSKSGTLDQINASLTAAAPKLASGIYILKVQTSAQVYQTKAVKQ